MAKSALDIMAESLVGKLFRNRESFEGAWSNKIESNTTYYITDFHPATVIEISGVNLTRGANQSLSISDLNKFYPISRGDLTKEEASNLERYIGAQSVAVR